MTQLAHITSILQQIKPELVQKYHVNSIALFGSVVRDDFQPASDVDILVDFSKPVGIEFIDLADYIEQCLNRKVDIVSRNGIKDKYYQAIKKDILYV